MSLEVGASMGWATSRQIIAGLWSQQKGLTGEWPQKVG